ncbi:MULTISPECIES: hypothetical protein [unclassified Halomonas]|uniref:hypothetical protein n=1 Tax=unclassified Halomonas TaxID=2609666 RepID=UPI001C962F9C|nr:MULTISPECIES: hypothetical protein [unclassified Halomonas]MBY5927422.1 hypothetical protein [Halomonas sp. DP4Y7-2]MBY6234463.1 hypothetical protein [Halomonas sp. DP4Y7-1]
MRYRWHFAVLGLTLVSSLAMALERPAGKPLLKVSGDIGITNVGDQAWFDRDMLLALDQGRISTHLPWYDGASVYDGPLLMALLEAVDARGMELRVGALNDFAATIPVGDARDFGIVLAMSRDGNVLEVRHQGPLFVIYPFDERPHLYNAVYLTRSVWQVESIDVR